MSQLGDRTIGSEKTTVRPLDDSWRYTEFWPRARRKFRAISFTKTLIVPVIVGVFGVLTVMLIMWAIDIFI
ncbi:MAG: hypothetical protein P8J01_09600 [Acidimicrobiales bacterium]|nr:hypothetical protein [Acidimicrobiales bacterium]MDG1846631.1 hypothetical protein [Acidimicrobiales bacterium]